MNKITLIEKLEESKFEQTRMLKCQCMNHDEDENNVELCGLVLEWNDEKERLLDFNPEYWCEDCQIDNCDYVEDF